MIKDPIKLEMSRGWEAAEPRGKRGTSGGAGAFRVPRELRRSAIGGQGPARQPHGAPGRRHSGARPAAGTGRGDRRPRGPRSEPDLREDRVALGRRPGSARGARKGRTRRGAGLRTPSAGCGQGRPPPRPPRPPRPAEPARPPPPSRCRPRGQMAQTQPAEEGSGREVPVRGPPSVWTEGWRQRGRGFNRHSRPGCG